MAGELPAENDPCVDGAGRMLPRWRQAISAMLLGGKAADIRATVSNAALVLTARCPDGQRRTVTLTFDP